VLPVSEEGWYQLVTCCCSWFSDWYCCLPMHPRGVLALNSTSPGPQGSHNAHSTSSSTSTCTQHYQHTVTHTHTSCHVAPLSSSLQVCPPPVPAAPSQAAVTLGSFSCLAMLAPIHPPLPPSAPPSHTVSA
jgi:hypothetical protein